MAVGKGFRRDLSYGHLGGVSGTNPAKPEGTTSTTPNLHRPSRRGASRWRSFIPEGIVAREEVA